MLIGVDLDEILSDTLPQFLAFCNELDGTTLLIDDVKDYRAIWGGRYLDFVKSRFFREIRPVKGAQEAMTKLKKRGDELVVVTSRQSEVELQTQEFVMEYYPRIFSGVFVTNHPMWKGEGKQMTKLEVCKQTGVQVIIEDSREFAEECASEGIHAFLLDRPWNQGTLSAKIQRIGALDEILVSPLLEGVPRGEGRSSLQKRL